MEGSPDLFFSTPMTKRKKVWPRETSPNFCVVVPDFVLHKVLYRLQHS